MALTYEFLIARAEQAANEAEEATLDNVRRKALRSEAAWRDMADRAQKTDRARERARIEREIDRELVAEQATQAANREI